jgi:hypothetical protein
VERVAGAPEGQQSTPFVEDDDHRRWQIHTTTPEQTIPTINRCHRVHFNRVQRRQHNICTNIHPMPFIRFRNMRTQGTPLLTAILYYTLQQRCTILGDGYFSIQKIMLMSFRRTPILITRWINKPTIITSNCNNCKHRLHNKTPSLIKICSPIPRCLQYPINQNRRLPPFVPA